MEETESSSEIEEIGEISSPNPGNDQEHILEEPESLIRRLKEESRRCQLYLRTLLTVCDVITDLCLATLLFQLGYVHYPTLMILIDFLPGIVTLGFVLAFKNECHPLLALAIVAHPLLLPGISVAEFLDRNGTDSKERGYRLYVLDAAKYIIGNLQAPCQLILTSYLIMTDVLEPPWIWSTSKVDAQNNVVSFGPILTLMSIILSAATSFKACTETVDIMKLYLNNHVEVAVAWLAHFTLLVMFRIMAWTLIIICAGWYSLFAVSIIFFLCVGVLVWKQKFSQSSILGKSNLLFLEWPIPIFGLISPTIFLPESARPSTVSTPFKVMNQVLALSGNCVLMLALTICVAVIGSEEHNIVSIIVVQERLFLFLQVTLGLGAFSTLMTLLLIGSGHRNNFITASCTPPFLNPKTLIESLKSRLGDRNHQYLVITIRVLVFVSGLLAFVLPIALTSTSEKGSVTLLVAGYKGKGLTTHIDVLSYGKTCRAKGIPSLPEYRSEAMVQLIPGHHLLVMCGGQVDGKETTNTCLATQPRKKSWRRLSPMPFKLFNAASAVFGDKLYIVGGIDDRKNVKNTVLEYDPMTDGWTVLAEMASGLQGSCAVNLRHGLIVTGGGSDLSSFNADATYLGRTDEDDLAWVRLPTMLSSRAYHGCTFVTLPDFGAGILIAGGLSDSTTVLGTVEFILIDPWALTPITSSWIRLPNLNFPRHRFPSVGVVNRFDQDTVLVAGGLSGDLSSTDTIEELTTNELNGRFEWTYRNVTLLKPRHSISTVVVPAYYVKPCD